MNLIGLVFGNTAKAKRCRRGMERNWNMTAEPLQCLFMHPKRRNKKHRGQYLKQKYFPIKDYPDTMSQLLSG